MKLEGIAEQTLKLEGTDVILYVTSEHATSDDYLRGGERRWPRGRHVDEKSKNRLSQVKRASGEMY